MSVHEYTRTGHTHHLEHQRSLAPQGTDFSKMVEGDGDSSYGASTSGPLQISEVESIYVDGQFLTGEDAQNFLRENPNFFDGKLVKVVVSSNGKMSLSVISDSDSIELGGMDGLFKAFEIDYYANRPAGAFFGTLDVSPDGGTFQVTGDFTLNTENVELTDFQFVRTADGRLLSGEEAAEYIKKGGSFKIEYDNQNNTVLVAIPPGDDHGGVGFSITNDGTGTLSISFDFQFRVQMRHNYNNGYRGQQQQPIVPPQQEEDR